MIKYWKLHGLVLLLVIVCELIGLKKIPIGPGVIIILPMVFAMIFGGIISYPKFHILNDKEMSVAGTMLNGGFALFITKLGTLVGPAIPQLLNAGFALALQELGHFFGTVFLGLPVALLLGIKREAIGATFSIGREPNIAIIAEKFGIDSPEGRGVMAVYVFGTLFGAIYVGLLAGFLGATGVFQPEALAMGAGVGSGSMMASGVGAISAIYPESADKIATFAAASNLITTIIGIYFCLFVSLPVTQRLYKILEPIIGRGKEKDAVAKPEGGNQ